jgi:hypothetical protein
MWRNLSILQKGIFITLMWLVVPFAPEFILMSELGGIELVFSFLVLYYNEKYQARQTSAKPILEKLYHWQTTYSTQKCFGESNQIQCKPIAKAYSSS